MTRINAAKHICEICAICGKHNLKNLAGYTREIKSPQISAEKHIYEICGKKSKKSLPVTLAK